MKKFKRITALVLSLLILGSGTFAVAAEALSLQNYTCQLCGQTGTHTEDCELGKIAGYVQDKIEAYKESQSEESTGATEESTGATEESTGASEPSEETSEPTEGATEATEATEEAEATEPTACEKLLAAQSTEEMYLLMLDMMNNSPEDLTGLTAGEIDQIRARVSELDPEGDDADTQDILDTLAVLPNGGETLDGDPAILIGVDATWVGNGNITKNTVWSFENGAVITISQGPITVKSGSTLELKGYGGFKRGSGCTQWMFIVEEGAQLLINGLSEEQPITIDGNNVIATTGMISTSGNLFVSNGIIENGKNRSDSGTGGGIVVTAKGWLKLTDSTVIRNTATTFGGGIYCTGKMEIEDSEISYNRAMASETGGVNKGRGGGFYLHGKTAVGTLNNVTITENAAMYYGGGGQVSGGATLTMYSGTVFSNNEAVLHGAGALHVTGDATFNMNGGRMENNTAQTVGGAIHSSYTCVLNLNAGEILNNTANGRAGGINVNTGGTIMLGSGLTISGNRANNQATGTYAIVDSTGDNWSGVKYEGNHSNNGYGGALCLDSAECVVAGATITDNYAAVGGGAIALVMINASVFDHIKDLKCLNFTMTSGTIAGNTTNGNGAGVYMMSNKIDENLRENYPDKYEAAKNELTSLSLLTDIPVANVSGGTINNNTATGSGGGFYLEKNTKFIIGGTGDISSNKAIDGAGVYIAQGTAEINGGTIENNVATGNGGALYVLGNVDMTDGSISDNTAVNGAALYVNSNTDVTGDFKMSNGTISANTASGNGGAAYVAGGDVKIEHGNLDSNNAVQGGAVYMDGGNLTMESGTMNGNHASDDGGAIYATSGTIYIGLVACNAENEDAFNSCEHHTALGEGRHHPEIKNNEAADTGGGIAIANEGTVHFYCGTATDNTALYKGVGKNVFMDGGEFHLYDGANVGVPRDPDLVIVGGKLHNECVNKKYLKLNYYFQNSDTDTQMVGLAEFEEIMNLPDGEYFWDAPEGYVFLGWTAQGAASGNQSNANVRNKEQYVNSGEPVEIIDNTSTHTDQTGINTTRLFDGKSDDILHLYALWAPKSSRITYVDGMTGKEISNTPTEYTFTRESNIINIQPVKKNGYDLVGWYIYQDEGQNANWNETLDDVSYEPAYSGGDLDYTKLKLIDLDSRNGILKLEAGNTNFGDITLIAYYVPAFTDLRITKSGWQSVDENQTFLFKVCGDPSDNTIPAFEMTVVLCGNDETLIKHLPVGEYTVTELTSWSWRYDLSKIEMERAGGTVTGNTVAFTLSDSTLVDDLAVTANFTNDREQIYWLSGDSYCENWWGGNGGSVIRKDNT